MTYLQTVRKSAKRPRNLIQKKLKVAEKQIAKLFEDEVNRMKELRDPGRIPRQTDEIHNLALSYQALRDLSKSNAPVEQVIDKLDELVIVLGNARLAMSEEDRHESGVLALAESKLLCAGAALSKVPVPKSTRSIFVPADILYQAYAGLFPAERMMVTAGRKEGDRTVLSATFDVTGRSCAGHVRADPDELGRALIAMDKSETHLAAWSHSHPGHGAGATRPSPMDGRQYEDWIRDFTPLLLAAIFVEDGFVRFWGNALNDKHVDLQIIGLGVERVDNGAEVVCRLE